MVFGNKKFFQRIIRETDQPASPENTLEGNDYFFLVSLYAIVNIFRVKRRELMMVVLFLGGNIVYGVVTSGVLFYILFF